MTQLRQATGLVDGMGGEEIVPSGTMYQNVEEVLHPYFIGSVTSSRELVSLTSVNSPIISGTAVVNNNGLLQSTSIENATELFGYRIKAGSLLMGNSCSGLVNFTTPFTTENWFMTVSARTYGVPQWSRTGSCPSYGTSGARRASGCWIVGGSTTVVDWIAVGI